MNDYTKLLEAQIEELQGKLALSEMETEEYKKIVKERKGLLVVIQDTTNSDKNATFVADVVLKAHCKNMSNEWEYKVIKDRTGKTGKLYTLEQIRKKAINFWL
jgi:hypothetical protein